MNRPRSENKEQTTAKCARLRLCVFVVIGAMIGIELINTVRICTSLLARGTFRFHYSSISKGIWSFGAFVRPLDAKSNDFSGPLIAASNFLCGNRNPYDGLQTAKDRDLSQGFIYPPTAVIEMLGFAYWVKGTDLSTGVMLGDLAGRLCMLVSIVIAAWFLGQVPRNRKQWVLAIVILAAFFPVRWLMVCVNVQAFMTLFLVVLILAYAKGRNLLAGVMLGLAACLKPYLALLVLFGLCRREWKFVAGAVGTACLLILATIITTGIDPWKTYLFEMLPVMARGYGFYPNQSVNGIAHRWLGHTTRMIVGPESTVIWLATRISAVVFIGLSVCPRPIAQRKADEAPSRSTGPKTLRIGQDVLLRALDVAIAALAVTLASPIVWEHYYTWCIVLFSICAAIHETTIRSSWFLGVLSCSYILLGTYFLPVRNITSGPLTLVNSTAFFGAVVLLALSWYAQLRLQSVRFS